MNQISRTKSVATSYKNEINHFLLLRQNCDRRDISAHKRLFFHFMNQPFEFYHVIQTANCFRSKLKLTVGHQKEQRCRQGNLNETGTFQVSILRQIVFDGDKYRA